MIGVNQFKELLQSVTYGSVTTACVVALTETVSFAAVPSVNTTPPQRATTDVLAVISQAYPAVKAVSQKQLFDRNLNTSVIGAPSWLQERRKALRQMPPPTLEKVRIQLIAAAEALRKFDGSQSN
jgi:hypothetical protein